jgi:hypothetical protein
VVQGRTIYGAKDVKLHFSFLHPWLRKRYLPVALLVLWQVQSLSRRKPGMDLSELPKINPRYTGNTTR